MADFATATAMNTQIGISLAAIAPDGWQECAAVYWEVGPVGSVTITATTSDGAVLGLHAPEDLLDYFEDLREAMAEPETGAWFTAVIRLTPDLKLAGEFDWDHEPDASFDLTNSAYADDLERFPRTIENQPPWLQARLAAP